MRALVLIFCLSVSAFAQESRSLDAKGLYGQAMNKLTGSGVSRNDLTGIDLMTRSAELDYVPAQIALGYLYESGISVAVQPAKSAEWYRKAANSGDHLAEYMLGRLYFTGLVSGGRKESEKWLE